jgi:hypothetical protein
MRICLYVGKAAPAEKQEEWLANAKSTCDVYASNLYREFTAKGHEVVFASSLSARPRDCSDEESAKRLGRYEKMEFPEADHAICLEQNGWRFRDSIFFEKARAATKGLVCAICDHDQVIDGPQDILFTARRPVHPSRARYIGWAANPDMFTPEKDPEWLTIFIDHKYDPSERYDDTEALLKSATTYAARLAEENRLVGNPPRRVQVVFFSPDGLERIEPSEIRDVHLGNDRRTFYRRVPGPELAAWTRKTDIFVVTHGESMGLPVLENAMAGALVVAHEGFVKPELLRSLAHHEYRSVEQIDWDSLAARLNPARFRRRASHFTWAQVAQRMLDAFAGRDQVARCEPVQQGNLLIAPPPAVPDSRFPSFANWRSHGVKVEAVEGAERVIPTPEKPLHYVRRDLRKHPWPETFTFTFTARPNGRDDVVVWLSGELDDERAEVRFNLETLEVSPGRTTHGWVLLDANAVRVGDEVLCQVVVQSDYAPILRCYVLLARTAKIEFGAVSDEPGIQIRRLHLGKGVGLVADLCDTASIASVEWPAAVNA